MAFDPQLYDSAVQATKINFLAELERVVRGEHTTVDPRALLFVAAEVILEGRKADEQDLARIRRDSASSSKVIAFPTRWIGTAVILNAIGRYQSPWQVQSVDLRPVVGSPLWSSW
jgi:hypothetical protein